MAEDASAYVKWNTPIEVDPIEVEVTVPKDRTAPPTHSPSTPKVAQKVHIVIVYQNLAGDSLNRANHAAQIKYLMEASKMLGVNLKLKELSLQLSQPLCNPHHRESIINLI
jgi:hypothetical protein